MNGIDLGQLFNVNELLLQSSFNPAQIAVSLLITLGMALFIFWIYLKTYNGVLYSKNFNITLVITALMVNAIMIGISGNIILSLGMVGALSIIRFRTAVKDPKDTAFIFWAITIGVINGVGFYELSLMASLVIGGVLYVLTQKTSFRPTYMLILKYQTGQYALLGERLRHFFPNFMVRSDTLTELGAEKVLEVRLGQENMEVVLNELRAIPGVQSCVLLSSNGQFAE